MTYGRPTATLAGAAAGLAAAPLAPPGFLSPLGLIALATAAGLGGAIFSRRGPQALLVLLAGAAGALAGLGVGEARIAAIDAGAAAARPAGGVEALGYVTATPHRVDGQASVEITTSAGPLLVTAPEPVPDLPIGREVRARGTLRAPAPWERGYLERLGIARVLHATTIELTGARRHGLAGAVDAVRDRASAALGAGTTGAAAALLRGFVLGEDDRIDAATVSDFRRSGLAHLLAVSGENVALLALLAAPILALAGVRLRPRMLLLLALIGLYVLVSGASPSIQRAGVMGAATVIATMAGRPHARWHVVVLAAAVTLALNPRATGDPGWQLSFAAVIGIVLAAGPIRDALLPAGRSASSARRAIAEGAGVTIAATLATAPLMAASFGNASLTTLPANLLSLPAVAPVMWLGMLAAGLAQIPFFPVAPVTWIAGLFAAYIAQVAHWLGAPGWAQVELPGLSWVVVAGIYAAAGAALYGALTTWHRRRSLRPPRSLPLGLTLFAFLAFLATRAPDRTAAKGNAPGLRVIMLDVGQGDSILLAPRRGRPILVDGGPPGDGIDAKLEAEGVSRLGAALVTHDQSDHAGGIEDLLGTFPTQRLVYGVRTPRILREAAAAGTRPVQAAAGAEIRSGPLRLDILWPPRALEQGPGAHDVDPNTLALVALARWRGFRMLLTADAESESVPVDPGALDVLKVAHHGSADAGLQRLLDRSKPRLAVISVGAGNSYGHPDPSILATLASAGVPVMRTDRDGSVEIDVTRTGWSASSSK